MNRILLSILTVTFLIACKDTDTRQKDNLITIGVRDSIFSKVLNEPRQIMVYVPEGAGSGNTTGKKYPVVYLLDGDAHFQSVVGMIHQLSQTVCPEMIVVGIPNTDRTRDLTPTHVTEMFGDTTFVKTSGGAEQFTQFIQDELMPYIDKTYPTTPYRTLIGHSFGGLFAVNALVNHPDLFNNYLAIDPSLWWDDQKLSKKADEVLSDPKYGTKSLFVAVANTMKKGMEVSSVHTDTTESTEHIRSILEFNKKAEKKTDSGLNFKWKYYSEDSHGSVPLIAEYDALRFLFSWYTLEGVDEFFQPSSTLTADEVLRLVVAHYKNISEHFGYQVTPDEAMINSFGYGFLQSKKPDHAFAFFKLNTENYPQSANVFDSMGDYYLAQKDTVNAKENFSKAVDIGKLPYSKEKLDKLKGKN
jgi:predicted alpha/beta superfamily hydrolase